MKRDIKKILKEVYLIDESLKVHEKELIKIIQKLLDSKPENKINPFFVRELRAKVVGEPQKNMFDIFNKRFVYAFGSIVALVCLALTITFLFGEEEEKLVVEKRIKDMGQNAFGELILAEKTEDSNTEVLGFGGGGDVATMAMPSPDAISFKYVYKGEDFQIADKATVYRKSKEASLGNSLDSVLGSIGVEGVNLNNFKNKKINSMEISEDKDHGYSIFLDFRNSAIYINANWEKWSQDFFDKTGSISAEEAIAIADKFIAEYGIDTTMHGEGEILKDRGVGIMSESSTVVYPLKINGQIVYDEGGQKYGIYANVSQGHKKVMSLGNIGHNFYESSTYNVKLNKEEAIEAAEKGGMYGYYMSESAKIVEIELGTPKIELVKTWRFSEGNFSGEELFVPSLVFPVMNDPAETYFYRDSVIIPLVGEVNQGPRILPMLEGGIEQE